jgi:hypothetical protein
MRYIRFSIEREFTARNRARFSKSRQTDINYNFTSLTKSGRFDTCTNLTVERAFFTLHDVSLLLF